MPSHRLHLRRFWCALSGRFVVAKQALAQEYESPSSRLDQQVLCVRAVKEIFTQILNLIIKKVCGVDARHNFAWTYPMLPWPALRES
jgi:hypothetical protein